MLRLLLGEQLSAILGRARMSMAVMTRQARARWAGCELRASRDASRTV